MIFDEDDVLYILVEFESDRISPREVAKIGQMGAHGLICNPVKFLHYGNRKTDQRKIAQSEPEGLNLVE